MAQEINVNSPFKSDYSRIVDGEYEGEDKFVSDLWRNIVLTFSDWNIIDTTKENEKDAFESFILQLTRILDETYDRYTRLLSLYSDEKENLMKKLESVSSSSSSGEDEARFNDTPQTSEDGSLATDRYLTNYTKNNSKTKNRSRSAYDPATIISRLDEIARLYQDTIRDWTNEFRWLFWPSGGVS